MSLLNLKCHELEMFSFFEMTPDLVCIAGKDGFFKKVNTAVINKLEYSETELYARPIASFIFPDDQELTNKLRTGLLNGKMLHNFVNRYVTKSGKILWLEWTSLYFSDKEIVFAIAKDITERKQAEQVAEAQYEKFKRLAEHFKKSIETDRKYLAYELHEELAQLVSAVKLDMEWIAANATGLPETSKSKIDHSITASKLLIKTLQRISFSISPAMLDEFGLNATLEWLCREFSKLHEIPCDMESAFDEKNLTQEMKTDFFRICQEALTNVIDHSKAINVKISIQELADKIQLSIFDTGKGFEIIQEEETPGFVNIRERTESFNGRLTMQTVPYKGTGISVTIAK